MSGSWKKTQRIKSNIKQIVRKILCLQLEMRMAKLVVHKILIPPIISLLSGSPAQITVSPNRLNLLIPPAILGSTLVLKQRWSCLVSTVCHLWASPKFKVQDVRLTRDFPDSWLRCSSGLFTSGLSVLMLLGWIILILLNGALFLLISFSCLPESPSPFLWEFHEVLSHRNCFLFCFPVIYHTILIDIALLLAFPTKL